MPTNKRPTCKATEGCERVATKMGFCGTHYQQVKRGARHSSGHLLKDLRASYKGGVLCKVEGCLKGAFALGLCSAHYQQRRFNRINDRGEPTDPSEWVSYYNPERTTPGTAGPCKLDGCGRQKAVADLGLCGYHYRRFQLGIIDAEGNILREEYRVRKYGPDDVCRVAGCGKQARSNYFCVYHAARHNEGIIDSEGNALRIPTKGRPRKKNPRWVSSTGYVKVRAPEGHPHADRDGMIFEHRLVMERRLGRSLEPWELVHHKDGDKKNNEDANLELMDRRSNRGEGHPRAREFDVKTAAQVVLQQRDLPQTLADMLVDWLRGKK